ncbi:MAG TPA: chemotaxis protein CheA [Gemmatimonadaceae bacterium]|nr:chemotaxis protein CheA [Gemmatimonadaceae bacterium]
MDAAEYAQLFLTESREHVTAVNQALLELERGASRPEAAGAVDAIFRAVHTIKGMAGAMGYTGVAELSHALETVLDRVRRQELPLGGVLMETLFHAADVLEQRVEAAVRDGDGPPPATLMASLRGFGEAQPETDTSTWAIPSGDTASWQIPDRDTSAWAVPDRDTAAWQIPATERGRLVRVRIAADTPLRGVRAFLVIQAVSKIGEVASVEPPLEQLQAERFGEHFTFRLLTDADVATIERTVRSAGDVAQVSIEDGAVATGAALRPPGASSGTRPSQDRTRHVRIDVRRLDNLMNLIGELVTVRGRLTRIATEQGDQTLEEPVLQASRLITELRDEITASRLVPVSNMFDRFPRVVRDAARAAGKSAELVVDGKDIELDRSMLDEIAGSIVHLLRNAVDHGIEPAEVRRAAGKSEAGRIQLQASRDRSAIVIKVSDDGGGIDRERVLQRAKRDGLVDAQKTDLTDDDLLRLLARPGFSTADRVTELSGRGVGVDAVYTRVRALGGAMSIRSEPGNGTTVMIRLPVTLAIVRALLARVADETYAIPLAHVSGTVELEPELVRTVKGREVLLLRDDVLPLLRLRSLVGLPPYEQRGAIDLEQAVVIDLGDRRAGLVIDELTAQDEIVVKPYDATREGLPFFGGATLLGDGRPSLIVDVSSLL